MTSVTQLASTLQTLLGTTADRLARTTGFLRRQRQLTGASFAQALVCGWLADPTSTLRQLAQATATAATPVSRQAIQQRFTPAAAHFLRALLQEALGSVVSGADVAVPLLQRFAAVAVLDSTTIVLPAVLVEHWQGCGRGASSIRTESRVSPVRVPLTSVHAVLASGKWCQVSGCGSPG